jgi:hypothetical protein
MNMNRTEFFKSMTGRNNPSLRSIVKMVKQVKNGYTQCQTVAAGELAQFLFFDGYSCNHINDYTYDYDDSNRLSTHCSPRNTDTLGCSKSNQNVECVWTVAAPMQISQQRGLLQAAPTAAPVTPTSAPATPTPTAAPVTPLGIDWYFVNTANNSVLTPQIVKGQIYSRKVLGKKLNILVNVTATVDRLEFTFSKRGRRVDKSTPYTLAGEFKKKRNGVVFYSYYPAEYLKSPGLKIITIKGYASPTSKNPFFNETMSFTLTKK